MKTITIWTNKLDEVTREFNNNFGKLSVEQLNWKTNEKSWSIAQHIHHIIIINQSYYPAFNSLREGTYKVSFLGKIGFIVNFVGKTILNSVQPDTRKKIKTFPIWEPSQNKIITEILEKFEKHQEKLKQEIKSLELEDVLDKRTVISSPANKNIVYKLETALDIIVTHEQRHLKQAKEVLRELKN